MNERKEFNTMDVITATKVHAAGSTYGTKKYSYACDKMQGKALKDSDCPKVFK